MKKIFFLTIFIFIHLSIFAQNTLYEDLSREHSNYRAVENLVYKGVFTTDTSYFDGESKITKYDLALYLSRALNRIDSQKASRDDLLIIENLVIDFSRELNRFGFDVERYIEEVDNLIKEIEKRDVKIEDNQRKIDNILDKFDNLENFQSRPRETTQDKELEDVSKEAQIFGETEFDFNIDHHIYLKDKIFGQENRSEIVFNKEKLSVKFKTTSTDMNAIKLNLELETTIKDIIDLKIHSRGNRTRKASFYGHIDYINFEQDYNNSYGIKFGLDDSFLLFDSFKIDDLHLLNRLNFKFFDSTLYYDLNEEDFDFELAGKFPFMDNKILTAGGYAAVNDYSYYNFLISYEENKNKASFLYEVKNNEKGAFGGLFALDFDYEIIEDGVLGYALEIMDLVATAHPDVKEGLGADTGYYFNHRLKANNLYNNWEFILIYDMVSIKEPIDYLLSKYKDENDEILPEKIINEIIGSGYNNLVVKILYNLTNNLDLSFAYNMYTPDNGEQGNAFYLLTNYKITEDKFVYLEYLTNDREISYDEHNINFDDEQTYIEKLENNKIILGLKMNF